MKMANHYLEKALNLIREKRAPRGPFLNKIYLSDEDYHDLGVDPSDKKAKITALYCMANDMTVPVCPKCDKRSLTFHNVKRGFNSLCISCVRHNLSETNKRQNPKKNQKRAIELYESKKKKYECEISRARSMYSQDPLVTVREVSSSCGVPYDLLKRVLKEEGLFENRARKAGCRRRLFLKSSDARLRSPENMSQLLEEESYDAERAAKKLGVARNTVHVFCREMNIDLSKPLSKIERRVREALLDLDPDSKTSRKVIPPYEIDVWMPRLNLGIEVHGLYFHSEKFKSKDYHLTKQLLAEENEIGLIQLFEHELTDPDKVVDLVKSRAGLNERIGARKCSVIELSPREAKEFLDCNHLHGYRPARKHLGLVGNGEVLSCLSIGKSRFDKKYDWEITRFASKRGVTVVGGFSRLLRSVEVDGRIVSYCHRRLFSGNAYERVGFSLSHVTSPGYFWFGNGEVLSRSQTQKHKLGDTGGLSEAEYMRSMGYSKVYDAGQLVFVKNV